MTERRLEDFVPSKKLMDKDWIRKKLTVGLPFYGRSSHSGDDYTYEEIVGRWYDDRTGSLDRLYRPNLKSWQSEDVINEFLLPKEKGSMGKA